MPCRVDWSPLLELYEVTAEVKDSQGRTLMKGLAAKVTRFCPHLAAVGSVAFYVVLSCSLRLETKQSMPSNIDFTAAAIAEEPTLLFADTRGLWGYVYMLQHGSQPRCSCSRSGLESCSSILSGQHRAARQPVLQR